MTAPLTDVDLDALDALDRAYRQDAEADERDEQDGPLDCPRCRGSISVDDELDAPDNHALCWPCATSVLDELLPALRPLVDEVRRLRAEARRCSRCEKATGANATEVSPVVIGPI